MILDITLKENAYFLKIHRDFFENKSVPLGLFQEKTELMKRYISLGVFQISKGTLGFNGCLKLQAETEIYRIYKFDISVKEMRKFLMTVNLLTYYVLEGMLSKIGFSLSGAWEDQSLSFVILNDERVRGGYAIDGKIFPWFKGTLLCLDDTSLEQLNSYVKSELIRICQQIYQSEFSYGQITIKNDFFFIQVNMDGRWISYSREKTISLEEFSSHNIDHSFDQELCFTAIIAMNTWLREH